MKFRKAIEIGVMLFGAKPFLPRMQVGQWVTVDGNMGRWVGMSSHGTVWILWPNTCGRKNLARALATAARAIREWR